MLIINTKIKICLILWLSITGTGILSFKPDITDFWIRVARRMQIQEAKIVTNERKEEGISSHDQLKVKQANFKI